MRLVAPCLAAGLTLAPMAACGMSVGDEQSTLGGQGLPPLHVTPPAEPTSSSTTP